MATKIKHVDDVPASASLPPRHVEPTPADRRRVAGWLRAGRLGPTGRATFDGVPGAAGGAPAVETDPDTLGAAVEVAPGCQTLGRAHSRTGEARKRWA